MTEEDRIFKALRGPFAGTQGHLDAPYWQTPMPVVERMLALADVGPGDTLIDLGCGDGRVAIAAALRGAGAIGVDIDPERIAEAEQAAREAGVEALTRFRREDLFETRLDEASVVTMYLIGHVNLMLAPRLRTEPPTGLLEKVAAWLLRRPAQGALVGLVAVLGLTGVALLVGPPV